MWLYLGLHFVLLLMPSVLTSDARLGSEVHLHHDDNVGCEPTKCPSLCPRWSVGYHYYYDSKDSCLRCRCGRPKGLADCELDINPSLCVSISIFEECKKNSTVRESCNFSCSQSGQLWFAASEGNLEEINTAIAAGANPLCQKSFPLFPLYDHYFLDMTALHLAAWFNHPSVVVTLLRGGVDVNLQTTDGATPTYFASLNGSIDALEILIEHNADVNIASSEEWTPLMLTARLGHLSIAKALINANASLDVTGGWSNATALYYATYHNIPDIALLLIEHNADVNIAASDGETPLMLVAGYGHLSLAKALINTNASLDVTGGMANATALYYAAETNNMNIVLLLIELNADVNIAASYRSTPLMITAFKGHLSIANALINANASLDVTGGPDNATALYYATKNNNLDIALLLIENNADVNIAATYGSTPLMLAANEGHLSVAKALINANASLDVKGGIGNATALYYATEKNNSDIVLLLIEFNADINIAASYRSTPLMIAAYGGHVRVANALINASARLDVTGGPENATALHYAARYDRQDIALLLLQSGANTTIQDGDGRTPAESAKHYENHQLADLIEYYSIITANATTEDTVASS